VWISNSKPPLRPKGSMALYNIKTDINHPIVAGMEVLMNQQNLLKRHTFLASNSKKFLLQF
jgi:hypothetical protein